MGHMNYLDLQLREAGIDPGSVTLDEAIDLLRSHDINKEFSTDCAVCELPENGIITYTQFSETEYDVLWCSHRCRLAMPKYIAAELLGLEETYND